MLLSGFLILTFPVTFLIQPWTTWLGMALISNKSLFVIYENILQTWCTPIWWGNFFQVCQVETLIIYHTVWCMYPYTCANVHMHIEKYKFTNFLKNKGIQNQFQLTGGVSNPMAFLQKPSFIVYTLYITHTTHSIWKLMQIWYKMLGCYLPHVCLALEKKKFTLTCEKLRERLHWNPSVLKRKWIAFEKWGWGECDSLPGRDLLGGF